MSTKETIKWIQWLEVGVSVSKNEIICSLFKVGDIRAQLEISIDERDWRTTETRDFPK